MPRDAPRTGRITSMSQTWRIARAEGARTSSVVAGLGDAAHAARELHGEAMRGDHLDGRESPFGLVVPFSSSAALRWMASSGSSSRMRRRQLRTLR